MPKPSSTTYTHVTAETQAQMIDQRIAGAEMELFQARLAKVEADAVAATKLPDGAAGFGAPAAPPTEPIEARLDALRKMRADLGDVAQ